MAPIENNKTWLVTSNADSGPGSLREILNEIEKDANQHPAQPLVFDRGQEAAEIDGKVKQDIDIQIDKQIPTKRESINQLPGMGRNNNAQGYNGGNPVKGGPFVVGNPEYLLDYEPRVIAIKHKDQSSTRQDDRHRCNAPLQPRAISSV